MTHLSNSLLLISALAVSACSTSPDRFGGGQDPNFDAGGFGDPSSVSYFQEAVGDRVLFVVDTSTLTAEAQGTLNGQARFMNDNTSYTAIIEGHADERGTREYNLGLGASRAAEVRDYLISQGVSPERLRTVTYGKERPIEICSEEACYAQNRRAVTVLGVGAGS